MIAVLVTTVLDPKVYLYTLHSRFVLNSIILISLNDSFYFAYNANKSSTIPSIRLLVR